jgi:proline iminopeptidase
MNRRRFLLAGGAASAAARASNDPPPAIPGSPADELNPPGIRVAGIRMLPVMGGQYKVWTKRLGSGPLKVLVLHGGPGLSHEYLEALESFLPPAGIQMYYYDQLGCNNSDQPQDASLWTLERYVEEVEAVRAGLGLDQFVLYGHSWGGILAIDYALKYQKYLRGLVISNMAASMQSFLRHNNRFKLELPLQTQQRLHELEVRQDYDSPEYQKILIQELYPRMICRTHPWPEPVTRAFRHINSQVYLQMQGKSEFVATGNLRNWDRWDRLHEIEVRSLTVGARYDEMDPQDMERMAQSMRNARYAYCPNGSHLCMWDDQATYFRHLLGFFREISGPQRRSADRE